MTVPQGSHTAPATADFKAATLPEKTGSPTSPATTDPAETRARSSHGRESSSEVLKSPTASTRGWSGRASNSRRRPPSIVAVSRRKPSVPFGVGIRLFQWFPKTTSDRPPRSISASTTGRSASWPLPESGKCSPVLTKGYRLNTAVLMPGTESGAMNEWV